ncbi:MULTISPECIES: VCBS domain-containing protein [unclassified Bradyrhizobium]
MLPARIFDDLRRRPDRHTAPPAGRSGVAVLTGGVSFVALILSGLKEVWGADPDLALFERGDITYKDFAHGSFELVTKEAVPRHIIVDDPGQTVVLERHGSSVGLTQVANTASRMEDLQSQQQDVLANYSKEHGPPGSSTPPGETGDQSPQPINLIGPDGPTLQHALPPLVIPASFVPDAPLIHSPPTLTLGAGVVEVDTFRFDEFSASSGSFSATSFSSGSAPTFGIAGGITGPFTIAGASFDVEKPGSFGVLYVNSHTGAYTYVPNDGAINALKAPTTDNFTITASDGFASADQTFSIHINGADDASVIAGATAGSVAAVPTTFAAAFAGHDAPAAPTASGTLTDTDVDDPANTFTAVSTPHASDHGYGTFTMTTDGHWTYTLDDANPAVLALRACDTATDTFTVTTIGGTPQTITVTIQGADDPSVVSGDTHGCVVEAGGVDNSEHGVPVAVGVLTAVDVDGPPDDFKAVPCPERSDHGYGSFTMTDDGHWTYALDNGNCAVQALNVGDSLTDSFTVKTADGTAQLVTVTIEGSNDAATICGQACGHVIEPSNPCAPPPSASGTLTDKDVDNPNDTFTATACPQASEHGYGSFTMTAGGVWTYTLDPANPAVEALRSCDTLIDCFTVTTIDGTPKVVTVAIQGADDPHDQSFHFKEDAAPLAPASAAAAAAPDPVPPAVQAEPPAPHPTEPGSDVWHLAGQFDGAVHGGLPLLAPHHEFIV